MTRRLILLALSLAVLATPAHAQRAEDPGVQILNGTWKFERGDSPAWSTPAYDDRLWGAVAVPGEWEQSFPGYDGYGWYRRHVVLRPGHDAPVGVQFGTVGDAYEVYWNGVKIGGRGAFPPRFHEGLDPSLFLVPDSAMRRASGGDHVLAVRVYNDYAYGGLMSPVKVGRYDRLAEKRSPRDMVIGTLVAFFLAIGVYHLVFWLRRRTARENLWFALVSLAISTYGATYSSAVSALLVPHTSPYRTGLVALLLGGPFFVALVYALFDLRVRLRERVVMGAFVATAAAAAVLPLGTLARLNRWIDVALALGMLAIVLRACRAASRHRPHAWLLVLGTAAFAATFIYDLASEYDFVPVAHLPIFPGVPSLFWAGFLVFVVSVGIATAGKWALTEVTALVDPLTGLSRRHVLEDALRRETERVRRSGGSLAVVMIDLDFFKQVNDAYGHRTGDEVLARVGRLLRSTARNIDLPARFGGEEFAVLLYDSGLQGALAFAERFRRHLRDLSVPAGGGRTVRVTASLGLAVGAELVDPDALIDAADKALYRAKNAGRDRLVAVDLAAGATEGAEVIT
ncbi:MAG TPA: diguanylate cyclase, partial [Longimicrobium sp.]|nr:diguanylate cyclase [Longimicrobium sp.]